MKWEKLEIFKKFSLNFDSFAILVHRLKNDILFEIPVKFEFVIIYIKIGKRIQLDKSCG